MNRNSWPLRILRFVLFAALFVALAGFVVMSLWNWLMPTLFGLKVISFVQALGLLVLCKILFGGFRGGPAGGAWRAKAQEHWRNKMESRMQGMTDEEREKFRQKMGRCGPAWARMTEQPTQAQSAQPYPAE
ncbi:hypothetical protein F0P96_20255 [Hymenobacter busanensis]|uniref:Uncharacterized protein n=1 Tax=Hymenobacter busanensis TaxID=2607656 RepID=A0A7L4ZWR5_9BACT|nr:hypothetical protein [Hymenobacter busanensis]KAA9325335.1 hypothetical protein F0P96_20255 [Hymenobacter busanensis]QHJ07671.1 hypothetical protein GUY19_10380 [Hymenobacter busanensis]